MTSENNWFGEVLAASTSGERRAGRPIRPAQRFGEQGPGSSASPLELISGPIVPGPQLGRQHRRARARRGRQDAHGH